MNSLDNNILELSDDDVEEWFDSEDDSLNVVALTDEELLR